MSVPFFVTAIGTPLTEDEKLDERSLEMHMLDQWGAGISGILAGGTMGAMQLLTDDTYRRLVECAVQHSIGHGLLFVGAGDASYSRTRDRVQFLNQFKIDGVVVLPPYLLTFDQEELISYYRALAAVSRAPLFLYDLPGITKTKLRIETIVELSHTKNINGIKCSDESSFIRQLVDALDGSFRVFVAQPDLIDVLLRSGMDHHLDGVYAIAPAWVKAIGEHASHGRWDEAARYQRKLTALRQLLIKHGVFPTFTAFMNARGMSGSFAPRPYRCLSEPVRQRVLAEPIVRELLSS